MSPREAWNCPHQRRAGAEAATAEPASETATSTWTGPADVRHYIGSTTCTSGAGVVEATQTITAWHSELVYERKGCEVSAIQIRGIC